MRALWAALSGAAISAAVWVTLAWAAVDVPYAGADVHAARQWATVTPSDTVNFTTAPRAIGVTDAGNVVLVDQAGNTWTASFAAGEIKAVSPVRINSTNTTATGIKALY